MFVAIKECSAGNYHSGANWVESNVFSDSAALSEVFEWSRGIATGCGRLILSRPQNSEDSGTQSKDAQHTQAKKPSWGDVTNGIVFSTVGERDVAAEVFSRVARHFGCAS